MDSTTNRLSGHEIAVLISEGRLCPYPRGDYKPHRYDPEVTREVMEMTPEQKQAWLAERRKEYAAMMNK